MADKIKVDHYIKQAEEENQKLIEDLRLKATQKLLRERDAELERIDSIVKGIDQNLKQVSQSNDVNLLRNLADDSRY